VIYNPHGRPLTSPELVELIQGMDGMIAGVDAIDRQVIAAADELKVIARYGVGVDNVDLAAAREKGIVVTNTPGANTASVAELAVGLMLALARAIPAAVEATRAGQWPRLRGVSLHGKLVGLLGFGAIGQHMARLLAGVGCTVLAHDPFADPAQAEVLGVRLVPLDELRQNVDFLSLHSILTAETRHVIDAEFLAGMKPGAFLINTARGELVDEAALYDALLSGRLRGAALDVFEREPPDVDNPLLGLPQVLATPHLGAQTDDSLEAMGWGALHSCLAVLRSDQPLHRVV
jgi:D-3-phosphoglycerate dehydrogenase / 2-oxoglutarate reductase